MQSTFKREMIRTCGFSAGVLVSLFFYPPWNDHTRPDFVSDIVRAFSAGCIGIIIAEVARKFIPEQCQLDGIEERTLTEAEIKKLTIQRRFGRLAGLVLGFVFPALIYPWHEFVAHPYMVVGLCIYWAFALVIAAEIIFSVNPKQQVLTRVLRKNKSG